MEARWNWRYTLPRISVGVLLAISAAVLAAEQFSGDALKAAFLYRFPGYVHWPDESRNPLFTIAVLGADGVAGELERMLVDQLIKEKPARVRKISSVNELGDAQVLFIGSGQSSGAIKRAVMALEARPVLVVTDDSHGIDSGGTINFTQVERRIRFEISLMAAKRAGLTISSDLLSVALRIRGGQNTDEACLNADRHSALSCSRQWAAR